MSVRIEFGKYILKSDSHQWIVSEPKVRKSGERKGERWEDDFAFCSSLEAALRRIANQQLRDSDATTLTELRDTLDSFHRDLAKLIPTGRPTHA